MPHGMLVLATGRPNLTIRFSLDRGRTWSHSQTLFECERRGAPGPDRYTKSISNPGLVPVGDDTLLYVHDVSCFDPSQTDHWLQRAGFTRVIGRLDAVAIGLPTHLHAQACLDSFNAGAHVLCEKPPTVTAAEMIKVARKARQTKRGWKE